MATLVEKLHAIHAALTAANMRHAFGGAIALAYCTEEPRGTRDLDVNVFVDAGRAAEALAALPDGVEFGGEDVDRVLRDGQTRVWWDDTPVDLFLNNHPFHERVAGEVRWVPLAGVEIPILSCESLIVFKALFNRTKDWADIEAIAAIDAGLVAAGCSQLVELVGEDDEVVARLAALGRHT
ncbi:MAG: hypothetical protein ACRDKE_02175 [Solirubrobacterales bacterium]